MSEMFTIRVETHFQASHSLRLPGGTSEPVHDHDWQVTAAVSRSKVNSMGLVMDFEKLKAMLDDVVSDLDHVDLGTISALRRNNSSAENVAKYIYERLLVKLPDSVQLRSVRVVEKPGCLAEFSR